MPPLPNTSSFAQTRRIARLPTWGDLRCIGASRRCRPSCLRRCAIARAPRLDISGFLLLLLLLFNVLLVLLPLRIRVPEFLFDLLLLSLLLLLLLLPGKSLLLHFLWNQSVKYLISAQFTIPYLHVLDVIDARLVQMPYDVVG